MSTLPAVRTRLSNEETKQMVTSVDVSSPADTESRDPAPVKDKERKSLNRGMLQLLWQNIRLCWITLKGLCGAV